jgi:hypothetical protein
MEWWIVIAVFVVIAIAVVLYIWYLNSTSSSTAHSIVYKNKTIVSSSKVIPNTSDGISLIYYGSSTGIYSYNINTAATELVSSTVPSGLAYNSGLLVLDSSGNVFNYSVSQTVPIATGYNALYSTIGGYALGQVVNNAQTYIYSGSKTAANGNYGMVSYTVS